MNLSFYSECECRRFSRKKRRKLRKKKKDSSKEKEGLDLEAEESNNSPIDFYYDKDEYYNYADYDYGDDGLYQACATQLTSGNCNTEPTQLNSLLDYLWHAHCHEGRVRLKILPNKLIRFF